MLAAIVALVVQVVWHVLHAVFAQSVVTTHSNYVAALGFSVMAATDLVIVAALVNLARRLKGERKVGAVIATVAYIAIAASTIAYEGFNYRLGQVPAIHWWIVLSACYFVAGVVIARICAATRTTVDGELPRARVVG